MQIFTFFLSRFGLQQSVLILQGEMLKNTKEIDIRRFFGLFDQKLISKRRVDFKIHSADREGSFETILPYFMSFMSHDMCHKMP